MDRRTVDPPLPVPLRILPGIHPVPVVPVNGLPVLQKSNRGRKG